MSLDELTRWFLTQPLYSQYYKPVSSIRPSYFMQAMAQPFVEETRPCLLPARELQVHFKTTVLFQKSWKGCGK